MITHPYVVFDEHKASGTGDRYNRRENNNLDQFHFRLSDPVSYAILALEKFIKTYA